jgi:hypothetical protein
VPASVGGGAPARRARWALPRWGAAGGTSAERCSRAARAGRGRVGEGGLAPRPAASPAPPAPASAIAATSRARRRPGRPGRPTGRARRRGRSRCGGASARSRAGPSAPASSPSAPARAPSRAPGSAPAAPWAGVAALGPGRLQVRQHAAAALDVDRLRRHRDQDHVGDHEGRAHRRGDDGRQVDDQDVDLAPHGARGGEPAAGAVQVLERLVPDPHRPAAVGPARGRPLRVAVQDRPPAGPAPAGRRRGSSPACSCPSRPSGCPRPRPAPPTAGGVWRRSSGISSLSTGRGPAAPWRAHSAHPGRDWKPGRAAAPREGTGRAVEH